MELKEVVNLRKLGECYEEDDDLCYYCPFRNVCGMTEKYKGCIVDRILNKSDIKDLYDMEAEGTLTKDFQL